MDEVRGSLINVAIAQQIEFVRVKTWLVELQNLPNLSHFIAECPVLNAFWSRLTSCLSHAVPLSRTCLKTIARSVLQTKMTKEIRILMSSMCPQTSGGSTTLSEKV